MFLKGNIVITSYTLPWLINDGIKIWLSGSIENYEYRPNQEKYSSEIQEIINGPKNIGVLEAGTGLGKTLGYLFPAIKQSKEIGKCVLISCYTKNLQDQLFYKDLPVLAKAIENPIINYGYFQPDQVFLQPLASKLL